MDPQSASSYKIPLSSCSLIASALTDALSHMLPPLPLPPSHLFAPPLFFPYNLSSLILPPSQVKFCRILSLVLSSSPSTIYTREISASSTAPVTVFTPVNPKCTTSDLACLFTLPLLPACLTYFPGWHNIIHSYDK